MSFKRPQAPARERIDKLGTRNGAGRSAGGQQMQLPVAMPVVIQVIVDHAERSTRSGLTTQLPKEIEIALVENGYRGKAGALALNTLRHRISVLSKTHQIAKEPNPCADASCASWSPRLVVPTRSAAVRPCPTNSALIKEPL